MKITDKRKPSKEAEKLNEQIENREVKKVNSFVVCEQKELLTPEDKAEQTIASLTPEKLEEITTFIEAKKKEGMTYRSIKRSVLKKFKINFL